MTATQSVDPFSHQRMVAFCRDQAADARRAATSREESARVMRGASEETHRAAHKLAERMEGRRMPYTKAPEREREAQIQTRLAAKLRDEAAMYEAIVAALTALPQESR